MTADHQFRRGKSSIQHCNMSEIDRVFLFYNLTSSTFKNAILHLDKTLVPGYLLWFKKFQGPEYNQKLT